MRIPRIYQPAPLPESGALMLDNNATRHVASVLRLRIGDQLVLFDGHGDQHHAIITQLSKREVIVNLGPRESLDVESPLHITLAQGISKGDRMDFTIQKAVELGVSRIIPLHTGRSVVNLTGERLSKKMNHWLGVIISACEQCGRNTLPDLLEPVDLPSLITQPDHGSRILLDHRAETSIAGLQACRDVTLLIGPEGGLSNEERELAQRSGYQAVRMGPRVLRTETAALTALSVLQATMGDLR